MSRPVFLSRTYGGFTPTQVKFFADHVGPVDGKVILDPMGGQGADLATFVFQNADIWICDLNPAALIYGVLRDPRMLQNRESLSMQFLAFLDNVDVHDESFSPVFSEEWISKRIGGQLQRFYDNISKHLRGNPFDYTKNFWESSNFGVFAIGILLMASRSFVCYRASDNSTWIKKGGVERVSNIKTSLIAALNIWREYAEKYMRQHACDNFSIGALHFRRNNAVKNLFSKLPLADVIVTSPPYANRLDYTKLWAPEVETLCYLWGADSTQIRKHQIGSVMVSGNNPEVNEDRLPFRLREVLERIKSDEQGKASDSYYFPYFKNFALTLVQALMNSAKYAADSCDFFVFVRDTSRLNEMFETHSLVEHTLKDFGFSVTKAHKTFVKNHIGVRRRSSNTTVFGSTQTEWCLHLRRG